MQLPSMGKLKQLLILPIALLTALGAASITVSSASAAVTGATLTQCNAADLPGDLTQAGLEVICTISITNSLTVDGAGNMITGSASGTRSICLAANNVACAAGNTTTTPIVNATQPITTVRQCNGVLTGGGETVKCSLTVANTIISPVAISTTPATVNQCIGSATGMATDPATGSATNCQPWGSTTSATVTQCNGSGNGGTLVSFRCTVGSSPSNTTTNATIAALLPVTVNQCNGSSNGGGDVMLCSAGLTNTVNLSTATAASVPSSGGSPNNGYRAPDYHATLTPSGSTATTPVSSATPLPATPSPATPLPQSTAAGIVIAAQTPVVPATLPHLGGGYGEIERELLLASVGMGGLFAMSLWFRKRRKS